MLGSLSEEYEYLPYLLPLLLIVAVVAGGWFLFLQPSYTTAPEERVRAACQQSCGEWQNQSGVIATAAAIDYCTEAYDLGGEPRTVEDYCSDGVHCFNVMECTKSGRTLTASQCRSLLYDHYRTYNEEDPDTAAQHVVDVYAPSNNETGVGACDLSADWYTSNFDDTGDVR